MAHKSSEGRIKGARERTGTREKGREKGMEMGREGGGRKGVSG